MLQVLSRLTAPNALLAKAAPLLTTRNVDVLLAGLLAVLAIGGLMHGFDAAHLITADALYPVQLLDYSLFDFRPPPPNRLFPDVAVHAAVAWVGDPLTQKITAGLLLFALTVIPIGLFKGPVVFGIVTFILAAAGFMFVDSACHFTLPLLVLLFQLSTRNRTLESVVLAVVVFSNMLVLLPLMVLLLDRAGAPRLKARTAIAAAAFAASTLYADFGVSVVQLAAALPPWAAVVYLAQRHGLRDALSIAIAVALVAGAAIGIAPARYALPVAASLVVAITPLKAAVFNWRYAALPAALSLLFLATADMSRARQITANFDCLAEGLAERGITNIAADHWTAKPLYFAAKARGLPLIITQTDFAEGDNHPWMAPYSFFGSPTPWAVRNAEACERVKEDPTYCAQGSVAPVKSSEPVCKAFTLYQYDRPVPLLYEGRPANKLVAIERQLSSYVAKAKDLAERKLGSLLGRGSNSR